MAGDKGELDIAYVLYLRASEITVNIIPHHPDYRTAINQRPGWYDQFADLMLVRYLLITLFMLFKYSNVLFLEMYLVFI